jgi:hypothetical protein
MTDEMRELLTNYLEECWHIPKISSRAYVTRCERCGTAYYPVTEMHRTFTTPDDMDALRRKLVEKGDFRKFLEEGAWVHYETDVDTARIRKIKLKETCYIEWLMEPERFCSLVGEWLEKEARE